MCYNTKLFRELNTSLFLSDPRAPCFVFIRHEETRLLSPRKLDDVIQEEEAGTGRQVGSQVKKRNKCRNHPATPGGVGTKRRITRTEENVFLSSGAESDRQSAVGSQQSALYFRVQNLFTPAVLQRLRGRVKLGNGDTAVHVLINPSQLNRYTLVLFARTSVGLNVCIFVRASCLSTCRFSLTEKGTGKKMKKKVRLGSTLQACQTFTLSNRRPFGLDKINRGPNRTY